MLATVVGADESTDAGQIKLITTVRPELTHPQTHKLTNSQVGKLSSWQTHKLTNSHVDKLQLAKMTHGDTTSSNTWCT